MGALIFGLVVSGGLAALGLFVSSSLSRGTWAEKVAGREADVRGSLESPSTVVTPVGLAVLSAFGSALGVHRGHSLGWAWFAVAALFALAAALNFSNRRRMLATLGDRGRVRRTEGQERRTRWARRLDVAMAVMLVLYFGVNLADSPDPSDAYLVVRVLVTTVWLLTIVAWLVVRVRLFLRQAHEPDLPAD